MVKFRKSTVRDTFPKLDKEIQLCIDDLESALDAKSVKRKTTLIFFSFFRFCQIILSEIPKSFILIDINLEFQT